ncbi:MAG: HD domain-containing protein [Planctomycetota bacterium]
MVPDHVASYPDHVMRAARAIGDGGGRAFVVGGAVRDRLLGMPVQDVDLEVYGVPADKLLRLARRMGRADLVGQSFGIIKLRLPGGELDLSLPRREHKQDRGHKGFLVATDPGMDPRLACARRDLTINAMLEDPLRGEVLDFFGGQNDLRDGVLRHVSAAFGEDPLRSLRVVQLAARLRFRVAAETLAVAGALDLGELPRERIGAEFDKLLLGALAPSWGLEVLRAMGALRFFPELAALIGCAQEPEHHPEGDVWTHTLLALDRAAWLRPSSPRARVLLLAVLCHDLGKPATTTSECGRIRCSNHDVVGERIARTFLDRLTTEVKVIEEVAALVRDHLAPMQLHRAPNVGDGAIRRLALHVDLQQLVLTACADHLGRTRADDGFPAGRWLSARAAALRLPPNGPTPILLGRHLLERGYRPGPRLGAILADVFERQLDGAIKDLDAAIAYALAQHPPDAG